MLAVAIAIGLGGWGAIGMLILGPAMIALVAGPFAIAAFLKREALWCAVVALVFSFGPLGLLLGNYVVKQLDETAYQNRASSPAPDPLPEGVKPLTPGSDLFPPPVIPDRR